MFVLPWPCREQERGVWWSARPSRARHPNSTTPPLVQVPVRPGSEWETGTVRDQRVFIRMGTFRLPADEFRHEALMYAGTADFLAGTVPFIRGGLEAGGAGPVVGGAAGSAAPKKELGGEASAVVFPGHAAARAHPAA